MLEQVETCSAQTVNQNINVAAEVCKVVIKRTSGLTVKEWLYTSFKIKRAKLGKGLVGLTCKTLTLCQHDPVAEAFESGSQKLLVLKLPAHHAILRT